MGREYPLVFDTECLEGMRVIEDEGEIVSHVGVCVRDAALLGASLRIASIGAVCTDRRFRNKGYAGALMADAIDLAKRRGAHLMLISGDRPLYRRLGGIKTGRYGHSETSPRDLPDGLSMDEAEITDIPDLSALYQREPIRFIRSSDDWNKLLKAEMLMNQAAKCWIVRDSERALAYVAAQTPTSEEKGPSVLEYAGSRDAAWSGIQAAAKRLNASKARFAIMPGDLDFLSRAQREGAPLHFDGFNGTALFLDVAAAFQRIRPLWEERVGESVLNDLDLIADETSLSFFAEGERIRLDGPAVTAALFGPDRSMENPRMIPGIEPLPFFWYGYNYV